MGAVTHTHPARLSLGGAVGIMGACHYRHCK